MAHLEYLAALYGPLRQENKPEKVTSHKAKKTSASQLRNGDSGEGAGSPSALLHAQNAGSGTVRRDGMGLELAVF